MPADFIPVLEQSGMINAVGDWVMASACRQFKTWRTAGFGHIRVAVNLSVRQLRHGTLLRTVASLLRRYHIEPSDLELEITETMIMSDTENAVLVLRQLSEMGVHLTMDDFGTGYSSLSYLKRFPQNSLKIDRSFVSDITTDPSSLEIVRTVIQMGHSLSRTVVAEGVETEEQRLQLLHLGCDEMQGYLLSPPLRADDLSRMLDIEHRHRFSLVDTPGN
jgi:EAL domain-containing protein (putative c-di-GMP-specific phosphodiesterase class I)